MYSSVHIFFYLSEQQPTMRKFLFLLLIMTAIQGYAIDYSMQPTKGGQLYFVHPHRLVCLNKPAKPLSIDFTYLTTDTFVTINMTVTTRALLQADSIVFHTDLCRQRSDFTTFYIEKHCGQWQQRYSCKVPFEFWGKAYQSGTPLCINLYGREQNLSYAYPKRQWPKKSKRLNDIVHTITLNLPTAIEKQ